MLKETLKESFEKGLIKLTEEINLYKDENNLWLTREGISNSAGNLCLHLLGNLNHFIGATLGHTGYIRHREDEFNLKNIPRQDLVINISNCILTVNNAMDKLQETDFEKNFPLPLQNRIMTTMALLIHLQGHLNYHLGQINYHRRLMD